MSYKLYVPGMAYPEIPRLSEKEALILRALLDGGEQYGLQLVKQSNGSLRRGTVYVTLQRMEDKGFVSSRQEERTRADVGLPRRLYRLTGIGARVIQALDRAAAEIHLSGREVMS